MMMRRHTRGQQGFSLLEMLVVMVILAGIISLVPAAFDRMVPSYGLKQDTRQLLDMLRVARMSAHTENRVVSIRFDANGYEIENSQQDVQFDSNILVMSAGDGESRPMDHVSFYPGGGATGVEITLSRGGLIQTIDLDWLTAVGTIR